MPKMPVTASMAASRPMTPSATVAARAGNNSPASVSDQLCTVIGTFGCDAAQACVGALPPSRLAPAVTAPRRPVRCLRFATSADTRQRCGDSCQVVVFAVLRHAHHFRQVAPQNEPLSDRRRLAPHLAREGFVHDRHIRRLCRCHARRHRARSAGACRLPRGIPATSETRTAPAQNCSA